MIQAGPEFKVLGQELARRDDAGDARDVARQPGHPDRVEAVPDRNEAHLKSSLPIRSRRSGTHFADGRQTVLQSDLMPPFDFQLRTRVVFGDGAFARLGDLARELSFTRTLIVADPRHRGDRPGGARGRVARDARASPPASSTTSMPIPIRRMVEAGRAFAAACGIDSIVAIGGGSSLDCAKGINFVLTNGGTMRDYRGFGKATKPMLPSIGVPTTAGTGSEAQSYALISDSETHAKMACGDPKAAFQLAILDPELTPDAAAAGHGDRRLRRDFACRRVVRHDAAHEISDLFARDAWRRLEGHYERVLRHARRSPGRAAPCCSARTRPASRSSSRCSARRTRARTR